MLVSCTCSLIICQSSVSPSSELCTESSTGWHVCDWDMWNAADALGPVGRTLGKVSQQLISGLLDGVCNVINRIHIPLIFSRILSATVSAFTCSCSSHELLFQCPPWLEKLGNSYLSPEEAISGQKDLSWLWDVTSCRRVVVGKVKIFLFLCPIWVSYKFAFFFFPLMLCWNSSVGNLDFHNSSLIHGWLSKGPPGPWGRGGGASLQATAESQAVVRSVCLLPDMWIGRTPSGPLDV